MNELPLFAGGGFAKEVRRKYGGRTFSLFQEVFDCLPLAMVFEWLWPLYVHGFSFHRTLTNWRSPCLVHIGLLGACELLDSDVHQ